MPHTHAHTSAAPSLKSEPKKPSKGALKAAELAELRKDLGLTHRQTGELIGAAAREIQRYEAGDAPAPVALCNLLRLLHNNPNRLAELTPTRRRYNLAELERLQCEDALQRSGGLSGAAELLGITRHALRRRIVKHEIRWPQRALR